MSTKHTPGPWETEPSLRGNINVFKPKPGTENDSWQICTVYPLNLTEDANAKLIKASPDLLQSVDNLPDLLRKAAEVLEIYANRTGDTNALNPKLNWYADKIEAAIKKATYENAIQKSKL